MVSKVGSGAQSGFVLVKQSTKSDKGFTCSPCRWGDYGGATPDPAASLSGAQGEVIRSHLLPILAAFGLIILGSTGMVESALALADTWNVPRVLVGVLVLAPLTSIPNAYTGVRLGLEHRGSALVSEALNSNTINLVGGLAIPALFVSLGALSTSVRIDLAWLMATTVLVLVLLLGRRGMGRGGGAVVVSLYVAFVAIQVIRR